MPPIALSHALQLPRSGPDDPGAPLRKFSFAGSPEPGSKSKSATRLVGDTCQSSSSSALRKRYRLEALCM